MITDDDDDDDILLWESGMVVHACNILAVKRLKPADPEFKASIIRLQNDIPSSKQKNHPKSKTK